MPPHPRLLLATVGIGVVLSGIHAATLLRFRNGLQREIKRTIVNRDAAVLQPVVRQQIANAETRAGAGPLRADELLSAVLPSAPVLPTGQQEGMLAVAVFDKQGALIRALPGTLLFAELSAEDYLTLLRGGPISRFHPAFPFDRYFAGTSPESATAVLEVLLPLEGRAPGAPLGFAQYYIDARTLGRELADIETRLGNQTWASLGLGSGLILLVLALAYLGLIRAQRLLEERNRRLARANSELTLSAKTSALGQITSHLIHGLQGPVAGLRSVVANQTPAADEWASAALYAERMQTLISEVVSLLGDAHTGARTELAGWEFAEIVRQRNAPAAAARGLRLVVEDDMTTGIDGHTGGVLCLIATNLVHNAIKASPRGGGIEIGLTNSPDRIFLTVSDEGPGVPENVRTRLFEPGVTGDADGTGLGLAISRLLARQIQGELELIATGPAGTTFRVSLPATHASPIHPSARALNRENSVES